MAPAASREENYLVVLTVAVRNKPSRVAINT
jgi:hypothetical protein